MTISNNRGSRCDAVLSADGFKRLKQQVPQAWEELVACCEANLSKYILKTLIRAGLASISVSDIEQKTWETAWKRFTQTEYAWQGIPAFYKWLYSTALNHIRNYAREAHRHDLRLVDPSDYPENKSRPNANVSVQSPEDAVIGHEDEQEIQRHLRERQRQLDEKAAQLSEILSAYDAKKVQVYILAEVYGLKPREIARQLSMKGKTVRDYLSRMRAVARKLGNSESGLTFGDTGGSP